LVRAVKHTCYNLERNGFLFIKVKKSGRRLLKKANAFPSCEALLPKLTLVQLDKKRLTF
jgi:hypothetical protein